MSSVNFSPAKDAELAWLDGEIRFAQTVSSRYKESGDNNREGLVPVLGPALTVSGCCVNSNHLCLVFFLRIRGMLAC